LLDASIIDVYRNANLVIFLVNPRKKSSLEYIRYVYRYIYTV
jgi:hypothetical protein